jgi:hypothetical protein
MKKKTLGQQKRNTLAIFVNPWVAAVLALCPNLVLQLLLCSIKKLSSTTANLQIAVSRSDLSRRHCACWLQW